MTAPTLDGGPGLDALARTVAYLAGRLSPVQVQTLVALALPVAEAVDAFPDVEWETTYDVLTRMGLIDRTQRYGGRVTELGHAVLRHLAGGS